jgi:hypothetical protein
MLRLLALSVTACTYALCSCVLTHCWKVVKLSPVMPACLP